MNDLDYLRRENAEMKEIIKNAASLAISQGCVPVRQAELDALNAVARAVQAYLYLDGSAGTLETRFDELCDLRANRKEVDHE